MEDNILISSSLNPLNITSSTLLNILITSSAFSCPQSVRSTFHERLLAGLFSLFNRPSFSILSNVRDIVVTSIRQASASSFWFIVPCCLNSLRILGCPCPTVRPSSIKNGLISRLRSISISKNTFLISLSIITFPLLCTDFMRYTTLSNQAQTVLYTADNICSSAQAVHRDCLARLPRPFQAPL